MDIKEVDIIEGCYNQTILVDKVDLEHIPEEDIKVWLYKQIEKMKGQTLKDTFINLCWEVCIDTNTISHDKCEQCGDYNSETKLIFKNYDKKE